jgi:cell division septal protein FtsQ
MITRKVKTRNTLRSPEHIERKRKLRKIKIAVMSGVAIVLVVASILATRIDSFLVKSIHVHGNKVVLDEHIISTADEVLEGNYFFVVPRRNSFFIPRQSIKEQIVSEFLRIEHVSLSLDEVGKLSIHVVEREPTAVWCKSRIEESERNRDECYFMDTSGFVFASAPEFSGSVFFKYFGSLEMEENPIGKQFLSPEEFASLRGLILSLRSIGIQPISLNLNQSSDIIIEISDRDMNSPLAGSQLRLNHEEDFEQVYADIQSVLRNPDFINEYEKKGNLSYMDFRFGNRVFYKFLSEENQFEETEEVPPPLLAPDHSPEPLVPNTSPEIGVAQIEVDDQGDEEVFSAEEEE